MSSGRFTWGAHAAPPALLYVIDWWHPNGPTIIGAVPQGNELGGIEAAKAVVRLMETSP